MSYGEEGRRRAQERNEYLRHNPPPKPPAPSPTDCYICDRPGVGKTFDGKWVCDECNTNVHREEDFAMKPIRPAPKMASSAKFAAPPGWTQIRGTPTTYVKRVGEYRAEVVNAIYQWTAQIIAGGSVISRHEAPAEGDCFKWAEKALLELTGKS